MRAPCTCAPGYECPACKEARPPKRPRSRHHTWWSRDKIITRIQVWAKKHGRAPTWRDFCPPDLPSGQAVINHFGHLFKAREAAGLPPGFDRRGGYRGGHMGQTPHWPADKIIQSLKRFHERHDRIPIKQDFCTENGLPSMWTILKRFGTVGSAREAAGLSRGRTSHRLGKANKERG